MSDDLNSEALAIAFHDAYERRAGQFNYKTKGWTRREDVPPENQRLMRAVVTEVMLPIFEKLASLTEENERLTTELRVTESRKQEWGEAVTRRGDTIRGLQDRADELQREKNVRGVFRSADDQVTIETLRAKLSEAEHEVGRLTAAIDRVQHDLRTALDPQPNPESETDDG